VLATAKEFELPELDCEHLLLQTFTRCVKRSRFPSRKLHRPLVPGNAALLLLARHEQSEVGQPIHIPGAELIEVLLVFMARSTQETDSSALQQRSLPLDYAAEIYVVVREGRLIAEVGGLQEFLLSQLLQADQKMISGVGREALERGIPVPGRVEWKHLPELLPCALQKIHEGECIRSEIADPVTPGQTRGMKQNSAGARKSHDVLRSLANREEQEYRKRQNLSRIASHKCSNCAESPLFAVLQSEKHGTRCCLYVSDNSGANHEVHVGKSR